MVKNGLYQHFKGGKVFVFGTAKTPEDGVDVLYKGMQNGKIYARPLESFLDEVIIDEGKTVKRFEHIKERDVDLSFWLDEKID